MGRLSVYLVALFLLNALSIINCDDADNETMVSSTENNEIDNELSEDDKYEDFLEGYSDEMHNMIKASWKLNHGRPNPKAGAAIKMAMSKYGGRVNELGPYLEGDILFSRPPAQTRSAILGDNYLWPNGVVYYEISTREFVPREINQIYDAMHRLSSATCIRFRRRTNQQNYVHITGRQQGCFSSVGRQFYRGQQQLNLQRNGCMYKVTIMHELMHAIGFFHEQSRNDRDKFIQINWRNVPNGQEHNFKKEDRTNHLGLSYDFKSVMHYTANAFARDPRTPTILVKAPFNQWVKSTGDGKDLSETDIKKINMLYKCDKGGQ